MNKLAILIGTRREGSRTLIAAKHVAELASASFDVTLVDPRELEFKIEDDHQVTDAFQTVIKEADAFIFIFPEYNHMIPASMKAMLDGGSLESYKLKPVLLIGVSSGIFGGVRAVESIYPFTKKAGLYELPNDVYITRAGEVLEDGEINDAELVEVTGKRLKELKDLSAHFKQIRE